MIDQFLVTLISELIPTIFVSSVTFALIVVMCSIILDNEKPHFDIQNLWKQVLN